MTAYKLVLVFATVVCTMSFTYAQQQDSSRVYTKRVLDAIEVDFLASYYTQEGDNAAVSGGIGSEHLTDATSTIVVAIPLNADDVLTIDAGISAYTSASSSNVDPFDAGRADPFQASSGASSSDLWKNVTATYSHSSDDRNDLWSAKLSISSEYDYFSTGVGGSYAKLFNEKNTELSLSANIYVDTWKAIYPTELRPFAQGGKGLEDGLFRSESITGNVNYQPDFTPFSEKGRNSYSMGMGLSQILSQNLQGAIEVDLVHQQGLLSTPFQRVYFRDVEASFIDDFHLANDVERMPDRRFKIAVGGRLHWYLGERVTARTFYRYYSDDWGIVSHTANIEVPIKVSDRFTIYPSYRFYNQTAADHFAPYQEHVSTDTYYTSDYDLSKYSANQFGFGVSYTDVFAKAHIWKMGLKSVDLKFYRYDRNTTFQANMITAGLKFVMD